MCDPVVDLKASGSRSMGTNKEKVAELAIEIAKGMHDGGVLNIAKHYPGGSNPAGIDAHMANVGSPDTKEELIERSLYPYRELMKHDLLDGIMVEHKRFDNIDPAHPASLSKKVNDIIREQGFDGISITDALEGMQAVIINKKLTTVVHFGNPAVLEPLPHIPRVLIVILADENVASAIEVLAGDYPANGVLTADLNLQ